MANPLLAILVIDSYLPNSQSSPSIIPIVLSEDSKPTMNGTKLTLSILPNHFAICRLSPDSDIPVWSKNTEFYSITRSMDELSVVCFNENAPLVVQAERDWRAVRIEGPLDFSLTGVLACLLAPLAEAEISVFAISTYDTDYVLVREKFISQAVSILTKEGHSVNF